MKLFTIFRDYGAAGTERKDYAVSKWFVAFLMVCALAIGIAQARLVAQAKPMAGAVSLTGGNGQQCQIYFSDGLYNGSNCQPLPPLPK